MLFDWNFHSKSSPSSFLSLFGSYGLIALLCLAFSVVTDYLVFGRWTVNQLNFLRFNLFGGGGSFYGTHPWHWYFTVGLPAILVSQLPVAVIGWLLDVVPKTRGYHWLHAYQNPPDPWRCSVTAKPVSSLVLSLCGPYLHTGILILLAFLPLIGFFMKSLSVKRIWTRLLQSVAQCLGHRESRIPFEYIDSGWTSARQWGAKVWDVESDHSYLPSCHLSIKTE